MSFRVFLFTTFFSFTLIQGNAQNQWCATDAYDQMMLNEMSQQEREKVLEMRNAEIPFSLGQKDKSGTVYIIPVVVHVIHDDCDGNISMEQIEDGIRILNEDFRRTNLDASNTRPLFQPYASDVEIEFRLAQIDPNGLCTEGVVRVNSPLTYNARNNVKSLSYWSSSKYLNVWLVNTIEDFSGGGGTILGFAQFPGSGSWSTYGLVCRHDEWGKTETSSSASGRTPTHEVGHCLNLYHTFQSSCGNNCNNSGDRVCDTPPSFEATWGCVTSQNSCSNDANGGTTSNPNPYTSNVVDQIENYMGYDIGCQNMFSTGQTNRMRNVLLQYAQLANLISYNNVATGTNPGYVVQDCKPKADFCQEEVSLCEGNSVTFTDRSYDGPVSSRNWSFPGGTPASSSDSIVTVVYNTAGLYNVSLTVSNYKGSGSKTYTNIVNVLADQADYTQWKYNENFEDDQRFDNFWSVSSPSGGVEWQLTDDASFNGLQSVYLRNHIISVEGDINSIISPAYDLSAVLEPQLTYKVAYARKSASSSDLLKISYSTNCGKTWSVVSVRNSQALESVQGFKISNFIPANQSEWKEMNVNISSFVASKDNVRYKFEFTSGIGNNIYIDDINITSLTGIDEVDSDRALLVYPNPVSDNLSIEFRDGQQEASQIFISDLSGKLVYQMPVAQSESASIIQLNVSNLSPGIYFLNVIDRDGRSLVKKIAVQ